MIINTNLNRIAIKYHLGDLKPFEVKSEIHKLIDANDWCDGFELAVKEGDLDKYEINEIFDALEKEHRIDLQGAKTTAQLIHDRVYWGCEYDFIYTEDGSWILGDGLHVIRIIATSIQWATRRISFDGIRNLSLSDDVIIGEAFEPTSDDGIWSVFKIDYETGSVIKGMSIP